MSLLAISCVFKKPVTFIFLHFLICWVFGTLSPFSLPHPHFHKPYSQSKTFLNIQAVFFFSSLFLNFFVLTLMSPGTAILIIAQPLPFLFTTTNIWFPCFDLSVRLDHDISQNLHFLILNNIFWSMFIPFFTSFQVIFPTQFPMNYSCNIILPSPVLLLCQLFIFTHNIRYCFTFLATHSTKWWFGCFVYLVFHVVCLNCLFLQAFHFNFQVSFSQPVLRFFFIFLWTVSLYNLLFLQLSHFQSMIQLNSCSHFPTKIYLINMTWESLHARLNSHCRAWS